MEKIRNPFITSVLCILICVFSILPVYLLLTFDFDISSDKLDIGKTNYLTLTEKIYSNEYARDSALQYPLFVIDNNLDLHTMDAKGNLHLRNSLTPYSPLFSEFNEQIITLSAEDNFSPQDFYKNYQEAWIAKDSTNGEYYVLFKQNDDKCYFAIGNLKDDNSLEHIEVIFKTKVSIRKAFETIYD